jgi:hypothetical protein
MLRSSTKKSRLEGYLTAGDLGQFLPSFSLLHLYNLHHPIIVLTSEDIASIEAAGAVGAKRLMARTVLQRVACGVLVGVALLQVASKLGVRIF